MKSQGFLKKITITSKEIFRSSKEKSDRSGFESKKKFKKKNDIGCVGV
jgi:hypothetical protein